MKQPFMRELLGVPLGLDQQQQQEAATTFTTGIISNFELDPSAVEVGSNQLPPRVGNVVMNLMLTTPDLGQIIELRQATSPEGELMIEMVNIDDTTGVASMHSYKAIQPEYGGDGVVRRYDMNDAVASTRADARDFVDIVTGKIPPRHRSQAMAAAKRMVGAELGILAEDEVDAGEVRELMTYIAECRETGLVLPCTQEELWRKQGML